MKKLRFFILPFLTTLPLIAMSAKLDNNDFKSEEEKQKLFVLYDFIKLTGRQNAEIIKTYDVVSTIPEIKTGKMFWFKNKGYSIISDINNKIYEVNPDMELEDFDFLEAFKIKYLSHGRFLGVPRFENRDKPWPGERKRDKNKIKIIKSKQYDDFKLSDYNAVKSAKTNDEYKKYDIHKEKNGLIYSDFDVPNAWWFKCADYNSFGINSDLNSFNVDDLPQYHYYKEFPSYYNKTETYMKKSNGGICGYVAVNMLILYNEFFCGSGYYSEWEKEKFLKLKNSNFNQTSVLNLKENINLNIMPNLNSNFLKYLYQKTWFGNGVNHWWHTKYISESILRDKWWNSKINYDYLGSSGPKLTWDLITNSKKPTLFSGKYTGVSKNEEENKFWSGGHAIVGYGSYKDGRILCNYGWGKNHSQMIITNYDYEFKNSYVFSISHKWAGESEKLFNLNGEKYTGVEMTNKLRKEGYID